MSLPRRLAIGFLVLWPGAVSAQDAASTMSTSEVSMKTLLTQGFEIRSHQFFRCTRKPEEDAAVSCVNVVMQKGPQFATCSFDRERWLFMWPGPANPSCVLFR